MNGQHGRGGSRAPVSRRTLRLTFRTHDDGRVELVSSERLDMITPPQPGEPPQAGRHGGYWFELRDAGNRVLAHRVLDPALLNSVEVHSPEGTIRREFGPPRPVVFEVLLPDDAAASAAVLIGPAAGTAGAGAGPSAEARTAGEVARFDLPPRSGDQR